MADVLLWLCFEEEIPFEFEHDLFPPAFVQDGNVEQLLCVVVADKGPIDAGKEPDCQDLRGGKVAKADVAHDELMGGLSKGHGRQGRGDKPACSDQNHDAERIDPVPQTHRPFVDKDRCSAADAVDVLRGCVPRQAGRFQRFDLHVWCVN